MSRLRTFPRRLARFTRLLRDERSGVALVEFAYSAPILIMMISGGAELSNYSMTKMRVSALALQVADNASRIGDGDPLAVKKVYEANIADILQGALAQAGTMNVMGNSTERLASGGTTSNAKARIVISSLEPDPVNAGKNYIHWQRCMGNATSYTPRYGLQGASNLTGMGPTGRRVYAPDGTAVIFVEIYYRYEPLFPLVTPQSFGMMNYRDMTDVAAMVVRDDRDLSQIYPSTGVTASTC
jgi:Flp pilus assembly protein TadG